MFPVIALSWLLVKLQFVSLSSVILRKSKKEKGLRDDSLKKKIGYYLKEIGIYLQVFQYFLLSDSIILSSAWEKAGNLQSDTMTALNATA